VASFHFEQGKSSFGEWEVKDFKHLELDWLLKCKLEELIPSVPQRMSWRVPYRREADIASLGGLTAIPSSFGPTDRLEAEIKAKGMTVFARIDHAAGAAELGLPLRPTELLIFGNAKAGTPLMQANQAIGIDLPLKALVFEDAAGTVWLSYNDPRWLAQRHGIGAVTQTVDAAFHQPAEHQASRGIIGFEGFSGRHIIGGHFPFRV
jgi:uncharacterized protein (DUF302 family)